MTMHEFAVMEAEGIGFLEFLIVAAILCTVLGLGFVGWAASRPADNPLRQVAGILIKRIGITAGVGMVDLPLTLAAPPLGGVMDVVSFLGLTGYWIVGFWQAGRAFMPPKAPAAPAAPQPPTIVYMQPPMQGQTLMPLPPSYDRQPYQPAPPYPAE
jgi:hypothetical protein